MNILFTCAGRRNYLVNYFKEALNGNGQVFTADANTYAPALQEADKAFVVPPLDDRNYVDTILDICKQNAVRLLVPLNDLELPLLGDSRDMFLSEGVVPLISSDEVVQTCFDKWKTSQFLMRIGQITPRTYFSVDDALQDIERGKLRFPVVVKPRWGTASIGIEYPDDPEELIVLFKLAKKRIFNTILAGVSSLDSDRATLIQEKIVGEEYHLDVLNDLKGNYVATFVKKKLAMRAGETDIAVTVKSAELELLGRALGDNLKHIGNLDCDVFVAEGSPVVLEINPRFGGGYPFSHESGANAPAAIIAWLNGDEVEKEWLVSREGIVSAKCDRIVLRNNVVLEYWEATQ